MNVTVISTCYNQAELIGDAIQSVIAQQTDADVFQVVVDDGSTDNSLEVLAEWEKYSHIRVLPVTHRGLPGALNAGLLAMPSNTDYVVVLSGDDWLAPHFIQRCLNAVGDADMVVTGMRKVGFWEDHTHTLQFPTVLHPTVDQLWEWKQTYAWGIAMFRKGALVETGGFHPFMAGDCDWDMWIDLRIRGFQFAYAKDTWYFYRRVGDSLTRQKTPKIWNANRREMKRHHRRSTLPGPEFS